MKKIAVVVAGCGHQDGTELTEAVSLWVSLSQNGAEVSFFAPNIDYHPQNHLTKQRDQTKTRNSLIEAARLTRGNVKDIQDLRVKDFDGLAFPGGFGAALILCDWGKRGADCEVHPEIRRVILEFYGSSKPIAAICIAPVLLAKVLGEKQVTITLGSSPEVISEVEKTGAIHEICPVDDFITDRDFKVVTAPAYMYDQAMPHEVFTGIAKLAQEFVEMA